MRSAGPAQRQPRRQPETSLLPHDSQRLFYFCSLSGESRKVIDSVGPLKRSVPTARQLEALQAVPSYRPCFVGLLVSGGSTSFKNRTISRTAARVPFLDTAKPMCVELTSTALSRTPRHRGRMEPRRSRPVATRSRELEPAAFHHCPGSEGRRPDAPQSTRTVSTRSYNGGDRPTPASLE